MFKRIRSALDYFARTRFSWRTCWRHARPLGDWYSRADDEGNVEIVRGAR